MVENFPKIFLDFKKLEVSQPSWSPKVIFGQYFGSGEKIFWSPWSPKVIFKKLISVYRPADFFPGVSNSADTEYHI